MRPIGGSDELGIFGGVDPVQCGNSPGESTDIHRYQHAR
jgi:hypothetical protein